MDSGSKFPIMQAFSVVPNLCTAVRCWYRKNSHRNYYKVWGLFDPMRNKRA